MALNPFVNSKAFILLIVTVVAIVYMIVILKLKVIDENEILMLPKGESIMKILTKIHLV